LVSGDNRLAPCPQRIGHDELGHPAIVVGIARNKASKILATWLHALRRKRHSTLMGHVCIVTKHIPPAVTFGAATKVVLFTVASSERRLIEVANLLQRSTPDRHTKTNTGRQIGI
jgi:hypothetical protein